MDLLTNVFGIQVQSENWNKQNGLPLYIAGSYDFAAVTLNGCKCIVLTPKEELETLPALKKEIKKIQEIDNVPVVLKLPTISYYRRNKMIENNIPFITDRQIFLPFMGTFLAKENGEEKELKKFMFSTQQLVLLYLYQKKKKLYVSKATKILPFTAMTMSRAVKQLEAAGMFHVTKDGVNKVIESDYDRPELYERLKDYLSSPVRKVGYLKKNEVTNEMAIAGETVLAEETMLNPGRTATYAIYTKAFNKGVLMNELVDPDEQVRVELWEYDPRQFSGNNMADKISVALSFLENEDERIEEAVEELLEGVWGG
ncbi:MAG: MarR family transcriptional regulator [Lachnospiraceae bacterium]|nr:MarR family transcriptional regulator [Lachnospiraceae bacterium]